MLALLAAGGTAAVALHRHQAAPSASRHLAPVWQVRSPAADDELVGSWVTGRLLVRASTRGGVTAHCSEIDAFDTATGAKLWSFPATALATATGSGERVYALAGTPSAPQLVGLDPRTGRATAVAALPAATGKRAFTAGTVYVTPDGGVLELDAQGTGAGVRFSR